MARRPRMEPTPVGDVIDQRYGSTTLATFAWWDRAVRERIARQARPVRLARGTLIVHARTAAWAQELSFLEEDLLRSVQASVPKAGIERLRIRVGPLPPRRPKPPPPKKVDPIPLSALPPDVARGLAHVADEGLRDAMTKAARHALAPGPNRRPAGRRGRGR